MCFDKFENIISIRTFSVSRIQCTHTMSRRELFNLYNTSHFNMFKYLKISYLNMNRII